MRYGMVVWGAYYSPVSTVLTMPITLRAGYVSSCLSVWLRVLHHIGILCCGPSLRTHTS